MLTSILLCLAAWTVAPSAPPSVPAAPLDMLPEGMRFVDVERIREVDPLREYCCVQYMIQKGDTLSGIARRETGKATKAAVDDLLELNPDVDPKRLKIGQCIWLPPKKADAVRRYVFLATWGRGTIRGEPFLLTGPIYSKFGGFQIQIVEEEHVEEFLKAKTRSALEAMEGDGKLQLLKGRSSRGVVDADSGIARMKERIEVKRDKDGKFTVQCSVQHFDKKGRLIVPEEQGSSGKKGSGDQLWLLLLGLGGTGLVFFLAHQRARRASLVPAV